MQDTMIELINDFGYLGVALLIFIENIFPPIPSEVVLVFGGFLTISTDMNVVGVIIAATIGSVLGAIALYLVGYYLGSERIKRLFDSRVGRFLHLKSSSVDSAEAWFSRHGKKTVIICRCIPVLRSIISIPAGISKMKKLPFLVLTTAGSAVWNTILVLVGAMAGNAWEESLRSVDMVTKIIGIALAVVAVAFIMVRRQKKRKVKEQ